MKSSLSHLPQGIQDQILQIKEVIKEVVNPEKIILFGSYAKGSQVEDTYFENGIRYQYISDYDFLVIPTDNDTKEHIVQDRVVNRFRHFKVPVNIIVHDIGYVNEGLSEGQYFFTDIINYGVLLHDNAKFNFQKARTLSVLDQREIAQRYFDQWYKRGSGFLKGVKFYLEQEELNIAAFELHQATEHFYNTVLLVFTGYKPKTHNLDKLRQYAKHISEELFAVFPFPEMDEKEKHLFDLLKRGYIDARYKEDYQITKEELLMLIEKVEVLQKVTQKICSQKNYSLS
jgi:uncharacterized protein